MMKVAAQEHSLTTVATQPAEGTQTIAPPLSAAEKKVDAVATPALSIPKKETESNLREYVWTRVQKEFQAAGQALDDLTLGWDIPAQLSRAAGKTLLQVTEDKQKEQFAKALNAPETLYLKLSHIINKTFPGLVSQLPAGRAFQPVRDFLPASLARLTTILQELTELSKKETPPSAPEKTAEGAHTSEPKTAETTPAAAPGTLPTKEQPSTPAEVLKKEPKVESTPEKEKELTPASLPAIPKKEEPKPVSPSTTETKTSL